MEQSDSKNRYDLLALVARMERSGKPGPQKIYPQMLSNQNLFDLSYHLKWMAGKKLVTYKRHLIGACFTVTLEPAGRALMESVDQAFSMEKEERGEKIREILESLK